MNKQLVLLHSALCAYFAGNHTSLQTNMEEFHQKLEELRGQSSDPPSWLEELSSSTSET